MPAFLFILSCIRSNIKIMSSKKISYTSLLLTILSAPLYADTSIEALAKLRYFNYEEFDLSGRSLNKETGVIPGGALTLSNTQGQLTNVYAFEVYDGRVDYDGHTQSGTPHQTKTDETQYFLSYKLKWTDSENKNAVYSKIGWQNWDRYIRPDSGVAGLFERYQWWQFEAGIQASLFKEEGRELTAELAVLKTSHGTIEVNLSDFGYGIPELNLDGRSGVNTTLQYKVAIKQNSSIQFSLHYNRWEFGRSNSQTLSNGVTQITIVEPRSVSQMSTLSVGYVYLF